ncbi:unnamed protein product [Linum trigynum]|uniref:CCHC-type domain-containing protein n=1 Tax=Linum trigynum TaxID=586398 RepID=A0AAV2EWT3_9ROSI
MLDQEQTSIALARSDSAENKKDASEAGAQSCPASEATIPSPTSPSAQKGNSLSYKDTVLGKGAEQANVNGKENGDDEEEDPMDSDSEGEPDCPKVKIPKGFNRRRDQRWRMAIIVRVLGHSFPFLFIQRRLQTMWACTGPVTIAAMGQGFYSARFSTEHDYVRALNGGPWMIEDHYVLTRTWRRGFEPGEEELSHTLVWARLPKIPMDYYDEELLRNIGNSLGRYIKMDEATRQASRGHFARICVEVNLAKPLVCKYRLERRTRRVEYEGLHKVCFECGRYGHEQEVCPKKKMETPSEEDFRTSHVNPSQSTIEEERPEIFQDYGPWMIATSNRRRRVHNNQKVVGTEANTAARKVSVPSGSRFEALESLNDELREHATVLAETNKRVDEEVTPEAGQADLVGEPRLSRDSVGAKRGSNKNQVVKNSSVVNNNEASKVQKKNKEGGKAASNVQPKAKEGTGVQGNKSSGKDKGLVSHQADKRKQGEKQEVPKTGRKQTMQSKTPNQAGSGTNGTSGQYVPAKTPPPRRADPPSKPVARSLDLNTSADTSQGVHQESYVNPSAASSAKPSEMEVETA